MVAKIAAAQVSTLNMREYENTSQKTNSAEQAKEQCEILQKYFLIILTKKPQIFHQIILRSIQKSPKMNEVISCQMYCVRDLTKWPKLDRIATAIQEFVRRQIFDNQMKADIVAQESYELGKVHFRYAQGAIPILRIPLIETRKSCACCRNSPIEEAPTAMQLGSLLKSLEPI